MVLLLVFLFISNSDVAWVFGVSSSAFCFVVYLFDLILMTSIEVFIGLFVSMSVYWCRFDQSSCCGLFFYCFFLSFNIIFYVISLSVDDDIVAVIIIIISYHHRHYHHKHHHHHHHWLSSILLFHDNRKYFHGHPPLVLFSGLSFLTFGF